MYDTPAYFLGANTPGGFYSLYSELIQPRQARRIYLLKGGAGCGKSTLMKRVEQFARREGFSTERILCSGDPDSLDAVLLPEQGIALADATAPHVLEPKFPGVVERYVNLGDCYDCEGLQKVREDIISCAASYPTCYAQAYRCLRAAGEMGEDVRAALLTQKLSQRLERRAQGILRRELKDKKTGEKGTVKQRFLSAVTHRGYLCLFETAQLLCPRIWAVQDSYSLAHELLLPLLTGAVERGYDVIACPDPMVPERLQHLLIPQVGLALLTVNDDMPFPGQPERRIRLDAMADPQLLRAGRGRLRFAMKMSGVLVEEGVSCLARAKQMHDELERLYNPYVDFERVNTVAGEIMGEIMRLSK